MAVPDRRRLMTAEELCELPDDGCRYELLEGELIPMTPAGARHSAIAVRIARLLDEYAEARDLGVCGTAEPGFILQRSPDVVRAPDVIGDDGELDGGDVLPGFRCAVRRLFP